MKWEQLTKTFMNWKNPLVSIVQKYVGVLKGYIVLDIVIHLIGFKVIVRLPYSPPGLCHVRDLPHCVSGPHQTTTAGIIWIQKESRPATTWITTCFILRRKQSGFGLTTAVKSATATARCTARHDVNLALLKPSCLAMARPTQSTVGATKNLIVEHVLKHMYLFSLYFKLNGNYCPGGN